MAGQNTDRTLSLAAERLDRLIASFLSSRNVVMPELGRWEAQVEAINLFNLSIRHAEGVITLAKTDWPLVAPAAAAARCALECSVRAAWLINDKDDFVCEARYLAYLAEEEELLERWEQEVSKRGGDASAPRKKREEIKSFRLKVTNALPNGTVAVKSASMRKMLASIGGDNLYMLYRELSQYAHGTHSATWMFRGRGLGTERRYGDFVKVSDWYTPLLFVLLAFGHPARLVLARIGGTEHLPDREDGKIRRALEKVRASKRTRHEP
jgi:hypothetical protein